MGIVIWTRVDPPSFASTLRHRQNSTVLVREEKKRRKGKERKGKERKRSR